MSAARKPTKYDSDLSKLRSQQLLYTEFERRHSGILHKTAKRWHRLSHGLVDVDDLYQDVLETTWRALDTFDPDRNVPLLRWVQKCVHHKMQKKTSRAWKRAGVERTHVEQYGRRDQYEANNFLANVDDVVHFRRRLNGVIGSVDPRTGQLVLGIVSGHGLEKVRQEVFADYTIAGAVRKSRCALSKAMKVAEGLED